MHPRDAFRAKPLVVAGAGWGLTHTVSSPIGLTIGPRQLGRNGRGMVVIGLGLDGIGYQQQDERGGRLGTGDISFLSRHQPLSAGAFCVKDINQNCQLDFENSYLFD